MEGSGWGVFAARDFSTNEIVDIAPLYLTMPDDTPLFHHSVLDDYVYLMRNNDGTKSHDGRTTITFGNTMFYNHLATPNIQYTSLGREPTTTNTHHNDKDSISNAMGWLAIRDIQAGEELFSTYGSNDGGTKWFAERGLEQRNISSSTSSASSQKTGSVLDSDSTKYCAKTLAGIQESQDGTDS